MFRAFFKPKKSFPQEQNKFETSLSVYLHTYASVRLHMRTFISSKIHTMISLHTFFINMHKENTHVCKANTGMLDLNTWRVLCIAFITNYFVLKAGVVLVVVC